MTSTRFLPIFISFLAIFGADVSFAQNQVVPKNSAEHEYVTPNMNNLSQLLWRLDQLDIDDRTAIDNFMLINECYIYGQYISNEFEWRKVRESTQNFILENKNEFPLRFEIAQDIRLKNYDLETNEFEVLDRFQVPRTRRFQISASDADQIICVGISGRKVSRYPSDFMFETDVPFEFKRFKIEPDLAESYISRKLEAYRRLEARKQTADNVFEMRDAYLVLKMKVFAAGEDFRVTGGRILPRIRATLESAELYGDKGRTNLLYSKNFRTKREKTPLELQLKAEYEQMKKDRALGKTNKKTQETDINLTPNAAPSSSQSPQAKK